MSTSQQPNNPIAVASLIEAGIKLGLLFIVVFLCFNIIRPFIVPVVWAIIIAVAVYPLHLKLTKSLGGRHKLSAILISLIGLAIIIVPTYLFGASLIDSLAYINTGLSNGSIDIPPPSESVKDWPAIGSSVYDGWSKASTNFESFVNQYAEQLKEVLKTLFSTTAGVGVTALQFIISVIIAGVFLNMAEESYQFTKKLAYRFMSERGDQVTDTSIKTIRSVTVGVLGVAVIQATLSGVGMLVAGIPAAGLWTLVVLVLAIVQLPPILILGPIAAYAYTIMDSTTATIFLVWALIVSASDGFLKPMFLGRGVDTPMLVILLGAIGGMIMSGIIGLFLGAVILALGYQLFIDWIENNQTTESVNDETAKKE